MDVNGVGGCLIRGGNLICRSNLYSNLILLIKQKTKSNKKFKIEM